MNARVQKILATTLMQVRHFLQLLALRHEPLNAPQAGPAMMPVMARTRPAARQGAQPSMASRRRQ